MSGEGLGDLTVAVLVTVSRLGLDISIPTPSNRVVAARLRRPYVVFGHTHQAEVSPAYANAGCFLRSGARTWITIERGELCLWQT